jgi:hypothetical protein
MKGDFTAVRHSLLTEAQARARVATAQFAALEKQSLMPDGTHRHPRLVEQYGYRVNAAKRFSEEFETLAPHRVDHYSAVLVANAAGRAELLRLHRSGEIHDSVLHAIEEGLDLEDVNVRRYV